MLSPLAFGGKATTSLSTGIVKTPDFYTGVNGVTIPSTGYRAIVGDSSVARAISGDAMSESGPTYFTFNNISQMTPAQTKDFLQLPREPSHYIAFDPTTLQKICIYKANAHIDPNGV